MSNKRVLIMSGDPVICELIRQSMTEYIVDSRDELCKTVSSF